MNDFQRFYSDAELGSMGFKSLGKNVKICRNVTIVDPSKISIGNNTVIHDYCVLTGDVTIGKWCHIGHYCHLSGSKFPITIGSYTAFSGRCSIYTESDDYKNRSLLYPTNYRTTRIGPVTIGNFVLIGFNSLIMPNVDIPEGCTFGKFSYIASTTYHRWTLYDKHREAVTMNINEIESVYGKLKEHRKDTEPLYITAEIGSSWRGDMALLSLMLDTCKEAGVDAVKFQAFTKEQTSHPEKVINSITKDNIEDIDNLCKTIGLPWYCTPCYEEAVDFLNPYMSIWKIRYKDQENWALLNKIKATGKPIIQSVNKPKYEHDVIDLYCVPEYPTSPKKIDLINMAKCDGWSCHTPLINYVVEKVKATRIRYLEFHIKPDEGDDIIDGPSSFNLFQMQELVSKLRKNEKSRNNSTS